MAKKNKIKEIEFPYLKEITGREDDQAFIKKLKNMFLRQKFTGNTQWSKVTDDDANKPVDGATDDTAADAAQAAAEAAQAVADARITTFFQDAVPTSLAAGDLWVDTNDKNKLYRATGIGDDEVAAGKWVLIRDTDIPQAISDAATAQSTADGKIITFYQSAVPTATDAGDLWVDTDDGKMYRATAAGDDQITPGEWERIDVGANPTLIDVLETTNAPAAAGADVTGSNTAADTALVNTQPAANVQKRAEYPWTKGVIMYFENDGFTESGVQLQRNPLRTIIKVTGGDASTYVQSASFGDWDVDSEFNLVTDNYADTGDKGDIFIGLHSAAITIPSTARHIGFFIDNGVMYATNANGTTQTKTDISGSITLTNLNSLKIVFDAGTNVKFYINDTLVATHTTNLPSGSTNPPAIHTRATSAGGEAQIDIKHTPTCVVMDL